MASLVAPPTVSVRETTDAVRWVANRNGCGYSIDVETPGATLALGAVERLVAARRRRGGGEDTPVRVLEIGGGESKVLARTLAPLGRRVAATFVDPGSDFSAFPRSAGFTFVRGVFPGGLAAPDAAFDVIYSSRCLHVNAPRDMVAALVAARRALARGGRLVVETTGLRSDFYQSHAGCAAYLRGRTGADWPGHVPAAEFARHWPAFDGVGDVTLVEDLGRLRRGDD